MVIKTCQWTEAQALELLARIAERDESAMVELHQHMAKRIYAFALNRLHDEAEATSVMVDTLFAVWEKPHQFRGQSQLSTWMYGIARNKIFAIYGSRTPQMEDLDELDDELEAQGMGTFELVAHKQDQQQIFGCLDTLPPAQRECLHLVFYEGLSVREIAQFQAIAEGTVKTRLFYGRKSMKTCLEAANARDRGSSKGRHSSSGDES